MNGNLASMSSSQMERNRYVMMGKFHRSLSVESGNIIRQFQNHRQTAKMRGTCQPVNSAGSSQRESLIISDIPSRIRRTRVTINVSGEKYQTYQETLERFPKTLLGDSVRRNEYFEDDENEYFFDRDRHAFAAIMHFYQSDGQVYCPLNVPVHVLVSEIKFFELGQDALNQALDNEGPSTVELPKNRLQREIWKLFEIPDSGIAANLLTIFSVLVIIFSVAILCIETLPYFKGIDPMTKMKPFGRNNFARYPSVRQPMFSSPHVSRFMTIENKTSPYLATFQKPQTGHVPPKKTRKTDWLKIFELCETGIVAWFTLEFLVRFFSCPNKFQFLKSFLNIIDLLAICPYYVTLAFDGHGLGLNNIRIIRLVRVFRIFKLSRHSRGLQILGFTLKASIQELGLLIFFLFIGVILFSSAIYYVEEQTFQSIPDAFWWAIITMCTVGYGDKVPDSFYGKLIGSLCAVCGVLTIALPVPVIVSNFDYFYQKERARKFNQIIADDDYVEKMTTSVNAPDYKRQELIERQKKLKRLQGQNGLVKQQVRWLLNGNASVIIHKNGQEDKETHVERESVV